MKKIDGINVDVLGNRLGQMMMFTDKDMRNKINTHIKDLFKTSLTLAAKETIALYMLDHAAIEWAKSNIKTHSEDGDVYTKLHNLKINIAVCNKIVVDFILNNHFVENIADGYPDIVDRLSTIPFEDAVMELCGIVLHTLPMYLYEDGCFGRALYYLDMLDDENLISCAKLREGKMPIWIKTNLEENLSFAEYLGII